MLIKSMMFFKCIFETMLNMQKDTIRELNHHCSTLVKPLNLICHNIEKTHAKFVYFSRILCTVWNSENVYKFSQNHNIIYFSKLISWIEIYRILSNLGGRLPSSICIIPSNLWTANTCQHWPQFKTLEVWLKWQKCREYFSASETWGWSNSSSST